MRQDRLGKWDAKTVEKEEYQEFFFISRNFGKSRQSNKVAFTWIKNLNRRYF